MENYARFVDECEADLRAGRPQLVAKRIGRLNSAKVPRPFRLPLANISRRTGLVSLGMRLLTPIVHPEKKKFLVAASAAELAEYAVLLQRCGAVREALVILGHVDVTAVPEAPLYMAYCHFNLWEYERALPKLEAYVRNPSTPYLGFVGRVNLASALVETARYEEAERLLLENIEMSRSSGYARLEGNCHEMLSTIHVHRGDLAKADASLKLASTVFEAARVHDQLFVKSRQALVAALRELSAEPLRRIRAEALERREWETAREMDLFSLGIEFDQKGFEFLYFGTPYEAFRDRVRAHLRRDVEKSAFLFGEDGGKTLELMSIGGEDPEGLPDGGKQHQLIEILLRDFYRPMSIGGLHAELFPGEHFNIFSAPHRVSQVIYRTRKWIAARNLPVRIDCAKGAFALRVEGGLGIWVPLERRAVDANSRYLSQLKKTFSGPDGFAASEAKRELGVSAGTFKRFVRWAEDKGTIERFGASSRTRYFFRAR